MFLKRRERRAKAEDREEMDVGGASIEPQGRFDRRLTPKKNTARYPIEGNVLLFATCGFDNLGDAMFGYNSGIMSGLLVNLIFIAKIFRDYGGADGTLITLNSTITGISVACLQASAAEDKFNDV
ncbi:hypothetical protein B0A55_04424 [Friedmanniomyces simplex]|uniref:Uncharacterized protein n=1 Tax=Friedmanniomyces simplex TaxID=329884 RepID=A0A4U0XIW2_9PEZI|nr:hypothetical protein B0A55_04424 [Friedmanniomyces simplex]